jgi:hypothetical protein
MRITNKQNLPAAFVKAASAFATYEPKPNRYSVTTLQNPPQMEKLRREHWAELEEDASDRVWAVFGQLAHSVMETHADSGTLTEEPLQKEIAGVTVSGRPDLYEPQAWYVNRIADNQVFDSIKCSTEEEARAVAAKTVGKVSVTREPSKVIDWKVVSVWSQIFGDRGAHEAQLNVYAWLLRSYGFEVEKIKILRDWSAREARQKDNYPSAAVVRENLPLWTNEEAEAYVKRRIMAHTAAIPEPCTDEDRWAKADTFAVMKKGRKTAMRVLPSQEEAISWAANSGEKGLEIVHRKGEASRCENYCSVRDFCKQYKEASK